MKKSSVLLTIFIVASFFTAGCYGDNHTVSNNDNGTTWEALAASNVRAVIKAFLKAGTEKRFEMMSKHYQEVTKTPISVKNSFDKEAYEIGEFIEVRPFIAKGTKKYLAYVRADVIWHFEGYDGRQTCHFQLVETNSVWQIDWFIC